MLAHYSFHGSQVWMTGGLRAVLQLLHFPEKKQNDLKLE